MAKKRPKDKKRLLKIVLGVVLITVIAGAAVYLQSNGNDKAKQSETNSSSEFTGSRLTTSGLSPRYSIVIPDGWVIERPSWESGLIFSNDLTYQPGKGTVFTDTESTQDIVRFMVNGGENEAAPKEYNTYQKTAWQKGNLNGTLYYHQFASGEKIGNYKMQGGEKDYTYYFVSRDMSVTISYFVLAGDNDQHELVEKVVSTLQF